MLRVEDAIATIPEETALVAHAAFPNGNVYLWIRDELGQIYQDKDFADLYDERGQPGWSAWRLASCVHIAVYGRLNRPPGSRCSQR